VRLGRELMSFALVNRAVWFVPLVLVLFVVVAFLVAGSAVAPYTLYTLF